MCTSLSAAGYDVRLVVADGLGDTVDHGVRIRDVGVSRGRAKRIARTPGRVLRAALEEPADLFHFHDPELLSIGLKLRQRGHRVVFDSHEDVPRQILHKPYLPAMVARVVSLGFETYQSYVAHRLDGVVAATPYIRDLFRGKTPHVVDVSNFPLRDELFVPDAWESKQREVCYIGDVSEIRGIVELTDAMEHVRSGATLNLCGEFHSPDLQARVTARAGWQRVHAHGVTNRAGVRDVLSRSIAGVVTLHPVPNYVHSQPIKMFEYMSAGIPVIASDFPLWRDIVIGNDCGLVVDPMQPRDIAAAIDRLVADPAEARRLGDNGRRAVRERYSWEAEVPSLLRFYREVLGRPLE